MGSDLVQTSKFLSYVLRHRPGAIGLSVDPAGWVEVDALMTAARSERGMSLDRDLLERVVHQSDKQRFEWSADGEHIRATYGHSIDVELGLEATVPPDTLYHGTARRAVPSIRRDGLLKKGRQHVHLSGAPEPAREVGARHGTPVVLPVEAEAMHAAGHRFYVSGKDVWLTEHVPVSFIQFP